MKKILFITVVLFVFSSLVWCADPIAFTLKSKGDIDLIRSEKNEKLITGKQLLNADELESKEDSFAAIKFIDGSSIVKLFPSSILKINATTEDGKLNKSNYLQVGDIFTKVEKKTGIFEVETPTTVVSVKGTNFVLSVSEKGETDVFTFTGEVQMKNKNDDEVAFVSGGYQAHSSGDGEIVVTKIDKEDIKAEFKSEMEKEPEVMEIELKNEDGEKRTIKIEFE